MIRSITKNDVRDTRSIKIEELIKVKGASRVISVIKEAINKDLRIACIGTQGSGKTFLLKKILFEKGEFNENETCDNAGTKEELEFINSNKCKYFTSQVKSVTDFLNIVKEETGRDKLKDCIVLTTGVDKSGEKYIKSIDEVTAYDGITVVNNLVTIYKDKYQKVNEITIA